ncbi:MAG: hypothetical protein Q4E47_02915 [Candidatus Saccharibacteria bacterium]|nr:hypothetical protein [Candidatus Saccharibacteria bacterium]
MIVKHNTERTSEAELWMKQFKDETGIDVEWIDPETIEGEIFATSHDVLEYPTVMVVDSNSTMLQEWNGKLPQFEDVTYVMRSV